MRVAVVLAPTASASLRDLRSSAPGDLRVEAVFCRSVAERNPALVEAARRLFEVAVVDDDPRRVDVSGWDAAVTFADPMLDYTDVLRARLGNRGAAEGAWDKHRQRRALADAGLSRLRSATASGVGQLEGVVADLGLPVIVKPLRGAGGADVRVLRAAHRIPDLLAGQEDRVWHVEQLIEESPRLPRHPWLGRLVSLEIATAAPGTHHLLAIFGKFPIQSVRVNAERAGEQADGETRRVCGDVLPSGLPAALEDELWTLCRGALDALEVGWRVTHTEVLLGATGPEIVEVNGRVGGFLSRVLARVGGVDLVRTCLELAAGGPPAAVRPTRQAAAGFFPSFPALAGTVRSAGLGKHDLLRLPGVVAVEGLARTDQDYAMIDARMANVVLAADDLDALGATFERVVTTLDRGFAADGGLRRTWDGTGYPVSG